MARTISAVLCAAPLLVALSWMDGFPDAEAGTNEWTTTGPAGGTIQALAVDPRTPGTLYAGTLKGVFKSTDGGNRWNTTNTDQPVSSLAIDPQAPTTIYAGAYRAFTNSPNVLKSTDGGATWSASLPIPVFSDVSALAVDPQRQSIVYAGTWYGLFKSTDGGMTWRLSSAGLTGLALMVSAIAIDPVVPDNMFAGTSEGIFMSTNGGGSWSATSLHTPTGQIVFDPATPATLYAAAGLDVYRSADGGSTWTKLDTGLGVSVGALAIDPQTPATLYAATGSTIFKSVDGGASWKRKARPGARILTLAIDPLNPANVYAGAEEQGVLKSADAGESWSHSSAGMRLRETYDLAIDTRDPTVIYASTFGGVLKSAGGESDWTQTDLTVPVYRLAIDPGNPSTLYAGTVYTGIYKTPDGGATWIASFSGAWALSLAVSPETPATIYAGYEIPRDRPVPRNFGVIKSTDGSRSYSRTGIVLSYSPIVALAIDPRTPDTVYAGTSGYNTGFEGRGVFKSTDGGSSWVAINTGLNHPDVRALAIDPQAPNTLYAATNGGVYKSTDGGAGWSAVNAGLADLSIVTLAIDPRNPASVYAGTAGGGVFKSADGGDSWTPLGTGLPPGPVNKLVVGPTDPATVYAATNSGAYVLQERKRNRPPAADAGPDLVVEATGSDGAMVTLDGSGSSDPDGDALAFGWSCPAGRATGVRPTVGLPMGTTTVTLTVSDPQGTTATDTVQISVRDTTPPALQAALTRTDKVGGSEGTFLVGYGATDLCSSPSVTAVMGMPAGGEALRVEYAPDGSEAGRSRVVVDFGKGLITLEGGDEATLRALLARMVADGGARVAPGQELGLRLDAERKQRYTFTFNAGVLVEEKAPAISLSATAYDAAGNSSTASAAPVFGGVKSRGGGARR